MIFKGLLILSFVFCSSFAKAELNGREKFSIIMYSTVGGAILGLSTLSFYGKPSDHVGNIYTGAALGLIGGASYVGYKTLQPSQDSPKPNYEFGLVPIDKNQWTAVYAFYF